MVIFIEAAPIARWVGGNPFGAVVVVGLMGVPFAVFAWLVLNLPRALALAVGVFVALSWPIALAADPALLHASQATASSSATATALGCIFQARVSGPGVVAAANCDPGHGVSESHLVSFEDGEYAASWFKTATASVASDPTAQCSPSQGWRPGGAESDVGSKVTCLTSDSAWIIWTDDRTHSVMSARRTDRDEGALVQWFTTVP